MKTPDKAPPGPPPDRCTGWDKFCGKYDKAHGYDRWERKKNLQYVKGLGHLCRPCYRAWRKHKKQLPVKPETNDSLRDS
jgi:hypothetical protein